MQTKQGQYGTLYRYKITYVSWDDCVGQCTKYYWAYDKEHALQKYQESFESDYELDSSKLLDIVLH